MITRQRLNNHLLFISELTQRRDRCLYQNSHRGETVVYIRTHTEERPFHCDICSCKATQKYPKYLLTQHRLSHTVRDKPYKCYPCDFMTARKDSLTSHARIHTGEKPFICSECDFICHLTVHSRIHAGIKPFICTKCDFKTAYQTALSSHMMTHTDEKPFACPHCSYKAGRKASVLIHLRTHTGQKPFCCSKCTYATAFTGNLKRHMLTHSGKKALSCTECKFRT